MVSLARGAECVEHHPLHRHLFFHKPQVVSSIARKTIYDNIMSQYYTSTLGEYERRGAYTTALR